MNPQPGTRTSHERIFRSRAAAMGLAVWDVSPEGTLRSQPCAADHGPVLAAWLESSTLRRAISSAVQAWRCEAGTKPNSTPPKPAMVLNQGWLIPVARTDRNRFHGWHAVLAMGEGVGTDPLTHTAAAEVRVELQELYRALQPVAIYNAASITPLALSLRYMWEDLSNTQSQRHDIDGLTLHLTDSYETMDTLYSIARAMSNVTHPRAFAGGVCDRLIESMPFDLIAISFAKDEKLPPSLRGWSTHAGSTEHASCVSRQNLAEFHELPGWRIIDRPHPLCSPEHPQALAVPLTRDNRVVGCLVAALKREPDPQISSYDIKLLEAVSGYANAFLDNAALYLEQKELFLGTLQALTAAIDAKDRYTRGHSERVAHLSHQIALASGMSEDEAERIRIAGLIHDVGKIGVPEAVLTKQGRLTDHEFDLIKLHPQVGYHILEGIPALSDILPGVLHHHERLDGKGYPSGLSGSEIPRIASIIALADTFDAMSSTRSYRAALPRAKVLSEIERCSGTQFEPEFAKLFLSLDLTVYDEMVARHAAASTPLSSPEPSGDQAAPRAAA